MEDWMPKIGEIVEHKENLTVFCVERRTRIKDKSGRITGVRIWATKDDTGPSFDLEELRPAPLAIAGCKFDLLVNGQPVLVQPIYEDDFSITVAVSKGDRLVHVKIPNIKDQVVAAALSLAKAFDGDRIEIPEQCPF